MNTATINNTGIVIGHFYKVPRGLEMPFAGRWLKAIGHYPGCVDFQTVSGSLVSLGNATAKLLAKHASNVRATSPKGLRREIS